MCPFLLKVAISQEQLKMPKRHFASAEMRKGCVAHFIRTRRRSFLDRDKAAVGSSKENGSTMGDGMARTDTLLAEEC